MYNLGSFAHLPQNTLAACGCAHNRCQKWHLALSIKPIESCYLWQVFEHVDMVTTDILATFLMAAAAQQCKRRAAVTKMVRQNGEGPLNLEAQTSQGPLLSARCGLLHCPHNPLFWFQYTVVHVFLCKDNSSGCGVVVQLLFWVIMTATCLALCMPLLCQHKSHLWTERICCLGASS